MKKFLFIICLTIVLGISQIGIAADIVNVDPPKSISPSTVDRLEIIEYRIIPGNPNVLVIRYRWQDVTSGEYSHQNRTQTFYIFNHPDNPDTDVTLCTGPGVPFDCCTGIGAGDCDESTTDFTDIFGYTIQAGDIGKVLGPALKRAILNKLKQLMDFEGILQ